MSLLAKYQRTQTFPIMGNLLLTSLTLLAFAICGIAEAAAMKRSVSSMGSRMKSSKSLGPLASMGSLKNMEKMWSMKSNKGDLLCQVKCTEVCRPKLTEAMNKCKAMDKECIMGQFSDEDKKSCDLKCT